MKKDRNRGKNNPMYGKRQKQSTKDKISEANSGKNTGKKNGAWKEKILFVCPVCGISKYLQPCREKLVQFCSKSCAATGKNNSAWIDGSTVIYSADWTETLREAIRQRDGYICQECGTHQDELGKKLDVHHIDYDKENCDPENLISLCRKCHVKTNFNREYWFNYFHNEEFKILAK